MARPDFQDDDFDYEGTGAGDASGSGKTYVSIYAQKGQEPKFLIGRDKKEIKGFSGRLVGFDIGFNDGNPEKKIRAGWEIILDIKAKDDHYGVENAAGTKIATYRMPISRSRRRLVASVLNALAATDLSWDGFINLFLYRKEDKPLSISIKTSKHQVDSGLFAPTKYEWDASTNSHLGVPKPIDTDTYDGDGNKIYDYHKVMNFWLKEAIMFYERFNGVPYSGEVGPCGKQGYTAGKKNGYDVEGDGAPATQPAQDTENPTAKFYKSLDARFKLLSDPYTIKVGLQQLWKELTVSAKKNEPSIAEKYGIPISELGLQFEAWLQEVTKNSKATFASGLANIPTGNEGEDLPF